MFIRNRKLDTPSFPKLCLPTDDFMITNFNKPTQ